MAIYYYDDPNGKYASTDGSRKFTKVSGKAAYDFLKTPEGKTKRFMKVTDSEDGGEDVFVELQPKDIPEYRKTERREQYLNDTIAELQISFIPLTAEESDESTEDIFSGEELFADESVDVVAEVIKKMELDTLRKALASLSQNEFQLIHALYLADQPKTECEMAEEKSVSQQMVNKAKKAILEKLKKFF